ncbi:hypothetical protein N0V86_006501 [Didymella sp. IMI 355093]|nr:hypothetical protein N0V86_006501 [Didymella sp. IMI 355093]
MKLTALIPFLTTLLPLALAEDLQTCGAARFYPSKYTCFGTLLCPKTSTGEATIADVRLQWKLAMLLRRVLLRREQVPAFHAAEDGKEKRGGAFVKRAKCGERSEGSDSVAVRPSLQQ